MKKEGANVAKESNIILLGSENGMVSEDTWVADTGATSHMVNKLDGMYDIVESKKQVMIGDGTLLNIEKTGKLKIIIIQKSGDQSEITLNEVKFVPDLRVNLFSITSAMKNGAFIQSTG